MTTADIVVFDLDNTLADHRHREYLIPRPDMMGYASNWDRFSLACEKDTPIMANIALLVALSRHYRIFILTSRGEVAYAETAAWLSRFQIPYDRLIMRGEKEHRPPAEVKRDWIRNIGTENILCAFDDNPDVCAAIRSMGVTCHQVS